jgi:hypothetical protein
MVQKDSKNSNVVELTKNNVQCSPTYSYNNDATSLLFYLSS